MTQSNEITVIGNLTADPELRYTQNGIPVANITIASSKRVFDREANQWKDGKSTFLRASIWRELAEHVAASFSKGQRVIASGTLQQEDYNDRDGNPRTAIVLEIDEIGGSVRFGTTTFTRKSAEGNANGQGAPAVAPQAQPAVTQQPAAAPQPTAPQYAAPAPAPAQQPVGVGAGQLDDDAF